MLCAELYGDDGHPASIRVEMSRLRKLLHGAIDPHAYGLVCDVDSDLRHVRALLGHNAVGDAAAALPRAAPARSPTPRASAREREELEGWLRQAVLTSGDADALWSWVRTASGDDDLVAWQRLLAAIDYADPRRSLAAARTAALRRSSV